MLKLYNSKLLRDISIVKKITFAYIIFIFIPILLISYYSYRQAVNSKITEIINSGQKEVEQFKYYVNGKIDFIEGISDNICDNTRFKDFLGKDFRMDNNSFTEYKEQIYPFINYFMIFRKVNISLIRIYTNNYSIPEGWETFYHDTSISSKPWYKQFQDTSERVRWLLLRNESTVTTENPYSSSTQVYTYAQKVYTLNGRYTGTVLVDIIQGDLFSSPTDMLNEGECLFILDRENKVLYSSGTPSNAPPDINSIDKYTKGSKGYFKTGKDMFIFDSIKPLDMKILLQVPLTEKSNRVGSIPITLGLLAFAILSLIILFYVMLRFVFMKFTHNITIAKNIIAKGFRERIPVDRKDEVGQIAEEFNLLIDRIDVLVKDVVKKETAQKDAQLLALQYQINPHFIYNTLDIFRMKMELDGYYEASDSIAHFARILRYNIKNKSLFSTLQMEIEYTWDSVSIQKLKYGDMINLSVKLPKYLSQYRVIKFILQPVIENSIKHGFRSEDHRLDIEINFSIFDGCLIISISDNGRGMSEDRLKNLNHQLENSDYEETSLKEGDGIGLVNINERLKLFYGKEYYIQLDSVEGQYTRTILRIPYTIDNEQPVEQGGQYDV